MGSVTIRNLDDAVKRNARLAAAKNGRSLEAELRAMLEQAYGDGSGQHAARIRAMSGGEFIDHLIGITRPGVDEDPFAMEKLVTADRDVFGAD